MKKTRTVSDQSILLLLGKLATLAVFNELTLSSQPNGRHLPWPVEGADVQQQGPETPPQRVWIKTVSRLLALHPSFVIIAAINRPVLYLCRNTYFKLLLLLASAPQRPFHPTHNSWVSATWLRCEGSTNSAAGQK